MFEHRATGVSQRDAHPLHYDWRLNRRPSDMSREAGLFVPVPLRGKTRVGIGNENDQVSKGHLVDALACTGDEGRDTLR